MLEIRRYGAFQLGFVHPSHDRRPRLLLIEWPAILSDTQWTSREKGIEVPLAKTKLRAKTRNRAAKKFTMLRIPVEWRGRMLAALPRVEKSIDVATARHDAGSAEWAIAFATAHGIERRS